MTGCSYCDGSGVVQGDQEMGAYTEMCPVCTSDLLFVTNAVMDALHEAMPSWCIDCGARTEEPESRCRRCRKARLSSVPTN